MDLSLLYCRTLFLTQWESSRLLSKLMRLKSVTWKLYKRLFIRMDQKGFSEEDSKPELQRMECKDSFLVYYGNSLRTFTLVLNLSEFSNLLVFFQLNYSTASSSAGRASDCRVYVVIGMSPVQSRASGFFILKFVKYFCNFYKFIF